MRHDKNLRRLVMVALLLTASLDWALWTGAAPGKKTGQDTAEVHLGNGYSALMQDRYEDAAKEFRAALAINPKLVYRGQFALGVALFEMHQDKEARREFEAVHRVVGDHPNILYYLGRVNLQDGDFDAAIKDLDRAAASPPFPDTFYYLAFSYFKAGDLGLAERWFKEAAQQTPRDARVQYQLGMLYRKQGRNDEAGKAFAASEEQRKRDENNSRVRIECAQKMDQGFSEETNALCEQLYDPNDSQNLTALGTIYAQHGKLEEALKCFRRADELVPNSPQMRYNLALVYYHLSEFENARRSLESTLKEWPDLFQLNALYGAVLAKLGDDTSAYQALRRAHQLSPNDSNATDLFYEVTLGLAQKSKTARNFPDSLHYLHEAVKLRPRDPEPHRRMADIYAMTANATQAAAERREAERLSKSSLD